jgi:hypothetical protein
MIPVAESEKIILKCPPEGRYSFYNSPYPSHFSSTGIDIYPDKKFGELCESPVDGKIIYIRKIRCPQGRRFEDSGYDVVTLVKSTENPERVIKMLHIEPSWNVGEKVEAGQELGNLLRSGYFGFGTSPHLHVEIRTPSDPLRARGGFRIRSKIKTGKLKLVKELTGKVTKKAPGFSLVKLNDFSEFGLTARIGGITGILDGGIPYYGWLGAHIQQKPLKDKMIEICGKPIAVITKISQGTCIAKCLNFNFKANKQPILGLSLRLSPKKSSEIKIIPKNPGGLNLKENSSVRLEIYHQNA